MNIGTLISGTCKKSNKKKQTKKTFAASCFLVRGPGTLSGEIMSSWIQGSGWTKGSQDHRSLNYNTLKN